MSALDDIALLRISPAAELGPTINSICLSILPPAMHQVCVVAGTYYLSIYKLYSGWGRMKENGEKSTVLREIHVPIISPAICNDFRHYAGLVFTPTMMCAGYTESS